MTESFIREMWLHPVPAMNVTVLGPGPVHGPGDDCEIHIGAEFEDATISDFANVVLEPPNVCNDGRKSSKAAWRAFYNTTSNRDCVAEGLNRTGFVGGRILREDVPHGTTEQVLPGTP